MNTSFYNTAHLAGAQLAEAIRNAKTQEEVILTLITTSMSQRATPWEVLGMVAMVMDKAWLIGSVRRAMHNLAKDGKLVKTDQQQAGPEGMPEHIWQLATQPEKQS